MKKFKEKMAAREGFTLVELIVVIAILGILAAVAVPTYSGYIKKANDAAVQTELSAILTAAQAANATSTTAIDSIKVSSNGVVTVTKGTDTIDETYYKEFAALYGSTEASASSSGVTITGLDDKLKESSYTSGATWSANKWKGN